MKKFLLPILLLSLLVSCSNPVKLADIEGACKSGLTIDLSKSGTSLHIDKATISVKDEKGVICICDLKAGVSFLMSGDKVTISEYKELGKAEWVDIDQKEGVFIAGMVKGVGGGTLQFIGIDDVRGSGKKSSASTALETDSVVKVVDYTPFGELFTIKDKLVSFKFDGVARYTAKSAVGGVMKPYAHAGNPSKFQSPSDAESHYNKNVFY